MMQDIETFQFKKYSYKQNIIKYKETFNCFEKLTWRIIINKSKEVRIISLQIVILHRLIKVSKIIDVHEKNMENMQR